MLSLIKNLLIAEAVQGNITQDMNDPTKFFEEDDPSKVTPPHAMATERMILI